MKRPSALTNGNFIQLSQFQETSGFSVVADHAYLRRMEAPVEVVSRSVTVLDRVQTDHSVSIAGGKQIPTRGILDVRDGRTMLDSRAFVELTGSDSVSVHFVVAAAANRHVASFRVKRDAAGFVIDWQNDFLGVGFHDRDVFVAGDRHKSAIGGNSSRLRFAVDGPHAGIRS